MLEHALVEAYAEAVARLEDDGWAARLGDARGDHVRRAHDLAALIRRLGGEPRERASVLGPTRRGVVGAAMGGDRGVILAMLSDELRMRRVYEGLARNAPPEVAELARRLAARTHLTDFPLAS